jgi:hypothetical protein
MALYLSDSISFHSSATPGIDWEHRTTQEAVDLASPQFYGIMRHLNYSQRIHYYDSPWPTAIIFISLLG